MMEQKLDLVSMRFYELLKKYRTLSDQGLCIGRGILNVKESWLLEELERAVKDVYHPKGNWKDSLNDQSN